MDGPPRKKHISEAVVYANCEGLDDAKAKKTATNWFHQLPEEIIMQVIHSIRDKVSILILRQTCHPSWLVALDPDSYLSDSDELTRGLMWCRDPTCAITKGGRGLCVIFNQYDLPHPKMPLSSGHDGDELKFDEHARRPGLRKRDQHKRVTKCTPANARELP
ncbi:hypothetical protein PG987_009517 [Apiospora arundinis]